MTDTTTRVALLLDLLGHEDTDFTAPEENWRHRDGRPVTDAEAEIIRQTPLGDFRTAMGLWKAELDHHLELLDAAHRLLELVGLYDAAGETRMVDLIAELPPADHAEAVAIWERLSVYVHENG